MKKKKPYGATLKDQLKAGARDRIHRFVLADGQVRGAILHGTRMISEMRANHGLGILETLVLGHAYLGAGLMSGNCKGGDRIRLQIDCSGPIRGLVVEANAFGEVRGYLKTDAIPVHKPLESFNLSPFFGAGILSLTRYPEGSKRPFTGQVALLHGSIAKDLAHYHLTSEQIPTAFTLSIQFDRRGEVAGAGGLWLQAVPGADEDAMARLEQRVPAMPSLGAAFQAGRPPESLVTEAFGDFKPQFLGNHRVEFMCHCSREKTRSVLNLLPVAELDDIRRSGPFPLEMRCHYCGSRYLFNAAEIEQLYQQRTAKR
jgi:molecular chaperone Hsp33